MTADVLERPMAPLWIALPWHGWSSAESLADDAAHCITDVIGCVVRDEVMR